MIFHSYVSLPEGNSCEIPMFGTSSQKSHPRHPQISHRSCLFSVHRIGTWRPQVPRWDRFGKSPRRPFRCSGDIKKKEWQKSNVTSVFSIPKSHPQKIFITSILLHCMVPNNWIYPLHWPTSMIELSLRLTYRKTHGFGKSFTNNGGFSRPNYDSLQEDTIQKKKMWFFPVGIQQVSRLPDGTLFWNCSIKYWWNLWWVVLHFWAIWVNLLVW